MEEQIQSVLYPTLNLFIAGPGELPPPIKTPKLSVHGSVACVNWRKDDLFC